MSPIFTLALPSVVGRGVAVATASDADRLEPKMEMMDPAATGAPAAKLAPLVAAPADTTTAPLIGSYPSAEAVTVAVPWTKVLISKDTRVEPAGTATVAGAVTMA